MSILTDDEGRYEEIDEKLKEQRWERLEDEEAREQDDTDRLRAHDE